MAHFADANIQARFPKREKVKKIPIKHYDCHRCGGSDPFNIYCPTVKVPPIIPGECRSCGTTTKEHANDCQYVVIKDNIGLCTYCQAQDHRYTICPQQIADQEVTAREKKKNKKNNKKRGKVRIVAGIMTREQESDSTLPLEKEERGMGTSLPYRLEERENNLNLPRDEHILCSVVSPKEAICSFCGISTLGYKDCPVMHQYIREQADALAQKRLGEYQKLWEEAGYEPPRQVPAYQEPLHRGGGSHDHHHYLIKNRQNKGPKNKGAPAKMGMMGSMYPRAVGGMAAGGGGGTPPPDKGGPPDDKSDDESNEEENDESDTDEETVSVTSSSQASAGRIKPQK